QYSSTSANIANHWVYWVDHTTRALAERQNSYANDWKSRLNLTATEDREATEMFYIYADSSSSSGYTGMASRFKDKSRELDG
ncbi:TonB-dependent siderophore receptor, partial [Pseudomonas syringae pv. tagetis]